MKQEIAVCNYCKEPLISTLAFNGSEYYCLICGNHYGMFDCDTTESDKELQYKKKLYERVFKVIYKDMIPAGCYRNSCEKCCSMKEHHRCHASEDELLKDKLARVFLNRISEIALEDDKK